MVRKLLIRKHTRRADKEHPVAVSDRGRPDPAAVFRPGPDRAFGEGELGGARDDVAYVSVSG
jgi:hypothetical protein